MWASPASPQPAGVVSCEPEDDEPLPPNPHLVQLKLHVAGITQLVPDDAIVAVLKDCLRCRPVIARDGHSAQATGYIEFEDTVKGQHSSRFARPAPVRAPAHLLSRTMAAERAYATANPTFLPEYNCSISFHINEPSAHPDPLPLAPPYLLKNLPLDTSAAEVFDLCRPFGPIHKATLQYSPGYQGAPPTFKGHALVVYYEDADAKAAEQELQYSEFGGQNIIFQLYEAKRGKAGKQWKHADAPASPSIGFGHPPAQRSLSSSLNASASSWSPSRNFSATSQTSIHSSARSVSSSSHHAAGVDPCNLFIKSLDPSLTTLDLRNLFADFGTVTSARVMMDEPNGRSKEFGFVSFSKPEEATAAMAAVDGMSLGPKGKRVVVRIHEPKARREERLQQRFASNGEMDYVSSQMDALSTGDGSERSYGGSEMTRDMSTSSTTYSDAAPAGSRSPEVAPVLSDQERLLQAVSKINSTHAAEIVDLLQQLPKKERALCLFNPAHLQLKVQDALLVLSASDDDEEATAAARRAAAATLPTPETSPKIVRKLTPPKSTLKVPSSLADLGKLPAVEIIELINEDLLGGVGVGMCEEEKRVATDAFMETLEGKPVHEMKQKLGDRLFKAVKGMGIKGAPRVTITLLDSEQLVPLAHLIDYPVVLKEKVLHTVATTAK
ncbi:polyadenylate-binding protein [Pseudohyphozyma bogoriensis]|nr:polyadenylate-binding protein [Pseudohyphozyma bogoriensis]